MLVHMAIGLAVVVGVAPHSLARDSRVLNRCESAGTAIEAEEEQAHQGPGSNAGISVDVPIGGVCLGPESVDGEPAYVRRTKAGEGMAIVEVSTTPFMPDLASSDGPPGVIVRPDQPASW